jgi:hypothetical protein
MEWPQRPAPQGNRRGAKVRGPRLRLNFLRTTAVHTASRLGNAPIYSAAQHKPSPGRMSASAALSAGAPGPREAAHEPPLRRKTHWEGNFQDLSGVFEAGHHRDVPSSPPKAAKLTFPMSLGPDGGLPRGPVESRTKHHHVCSGCLIDRLGSGVRHGRLHRLTMEKVTALKCYPSPRCSAHCEAHGHMANGFRDGQRSDRANGAREIFKDLNAGRSKRRTTPRSFMRTGARASQELGAALGAMLFEPGRVHTSGLRRLTGATPPAGGAEAVAAVFFLLF